MKLEDRHHVEGTDPAIQIGHRVKRNAKGELRVSRKWSAQYSLAGRHRYESLNTTNKAVAIRRAHEIAQRLLRGEVRTAPKRLNVSELTKQYLAMQSDRGAAPKTLIKYTQVLGDLAEWFDKRGAGIAGAFGERDFWAFRKWMADERDRTVGAKTIEDRLVIVKQLFKYAVKEHLLASNPLVGISVPDAPLTVQPCFTPEQVSALLAKASDWEHPIFATMAYTGMRFGEVRDLQWSDIQFDQGASGFIVIQRGGSGRTTKNKKIRRVPINPELRDTLAKLPRSFERVFTMPESHRYPSGDCPLNERTLIQHLKSMCQKCGFINPRQYKLHTFRHAFCSMCARTNVSYKYALAWMGHSDSHILDLYYTMFDQTAEVAMRTIQYPSETTAKPRNRRKAI